MRRLLALAALALACGPTARSARTGPLLPAKPADCAITVDLDGSLKGPHETIGLVEAEGTGGVAELVGALQREACALGADAIVELKQSVGSGYTAVAQVSGGSGSGVGTSYTVYHLTGVAIRLTR